MDGWKEDKERADRVLPAVKRILGEHLIGAAPFEEDAERNTDLIVLRLDAVRIACRIRTFDYWNYRNGEYREQFTLRSSRPNGVVTELTKVVSGWGDYFFYGFATSEGTCLHEWTLADLKVFRLWHARQYAAGRRPGQEMTNRDGSSKFRCFLWDELPAEFVIARGRQNRRITVEIAGQLAEQQRLI